MGSRDIWNVNMGRYEDASLLDIIATLTARLDWVYAQCNDPAHTAEEIGCKICSVIAGGRVGKNIYPDSNSAIDAAIAQGKV